MILQEDLDEPIVFTFEDRQSLETAVNLARIDNNMIDENELFLVRMKWLISEIVKAAENFG
jgi:hypothetical protein